FRPAGRAQTGKVARQGFGRVVRASPPELRTRERVRPASSSRPGATNRKGLPMTAGLSVDSHPAPHGIALPDRGKDARDGADARARTAPDRPGPRPGDAEQPGGMVCEPEERLRRLLDAAGIIPWEADPETWRFTSVGPQAARVLGHPIREWYGA